MTKLLWFLDLNKNERLALAVSKGTSQDRVRRLQVLHCPQMSND